MLINVKQNSGIAASKCNQMFGLIMRNKAYKEKELIIPQNKTIVRPHLQ